MQSFLESFKERYDDDIKRSRELLVDGDWHLKKNRLDFKGKKADFDIMHTTAEAVTSHLETFIAGSEGDRDKPGIQPYINYMVSTINLHLDRLKKYYPKNKPSGFKTKEHKREEAILQQSMFKDEIKITSKLKKLNLENDMSGLTIDFYNQEFATLPMRKVLCRRNSKVREKVESLDIDWDLIIDNGLFINMKKSEVPQYNDKKHFWDQETDVLQFWVSEHNKMIKGYVIDGYEMTGSMYFQINYFKTPIKSKNNEITNAPLRDNEWYIDEVIKYAEKQAKLLKRAGVLIWGTRRFSKTSQEVSKIHHGVLVHSAETGTAASSNAEDLESIVDKLRKSLDYIEPAFRLYIASGKSFDTKAPVLFGLKNENGRDTYETFSLRIINTDGGSKKGNQKLAGGNPKIFIMDEVGKGKWIKAYEAAIPSFESDEGWVCIPLASGTGGDEDLSADSEKVLMNPTNHGMLEMDWDLLEYKIPKEAITWKRRRFGWFMPAQMSVYTGMRKIKTNLADFLDIDSEELRKVEFLQTDWVHNKKVIDQIRSELTGSALIAEKVFRPIDPEECFMSAKNNPFPADAAKRHKTKLESEGEPLVGLGRKVILKRNEEDYNKIEFDLAPDEIIAEYPFGGGHIDAPGILYEDFPEERPFDNRFIASQDDYKLEMSENTDSVGTFYIFDRLTRRIVYSLATRPNPHRNLHVQIHLALDAWNAKMFPENADLPIVDYFVNRKILVDKYLATSFDLFGDFSLYSSNGRKWGWTPGKQSTPKIFGYVVQYAQELINLTDKEGNIVGAKLGVENIPDVQLLEEIIKYKDTGNYDRIIAFGGILVYDAYLTSRYIMPTPHNYNKTTEDEEDNMFGRRRGSALFGRRRGRLFS